MMWPLSNRNFAILCVIGIVGVAFSAAVFLNDSDDLEYSSPELYNFTPAKGDTVTFKIVDEGETYTLVMLIKDVYENTYLSDLTYYDTEGHTVELDSDVEVDKDFLIADPDDLEDDMDTVTDRMQTVTTLFGKLTVRHLELKADDYTYVNIDGEAEKGDIDIHYYLYNYRLVKYDLEITNGDHPHSYHSELISIKKA